MSPHELIQIAREQRSCTLSEWARRSGVGRSTLARLCAEANPNPRARTLLALLRGAGVDLVVAGVALPGVDEALLLVEREMERHGVTRAELARATETTQARLDRIFRARAQPSSWFLLGVFRILGCQVDAVPREP